MGAFIGRDNNTYLNHSIVEGRREEEKRRSDLNVGRVEEVR